MVSHRHSFKKNWDTIGPELIQLIQSFFRTGYILKELNSTFISLIPKVPKPVTAAEFIPIALCNTIYKVISKILANRMKPLLNRLISPFQSAFIPGRQISDNTTVAHELLHNMRKKKGLMGLKVDMSKAFDRVE